MRRLKTQPRPDWKQLVESQGLHYHTFDDQLYWDESVCYQFEEHEIDALEQATYELNGMCLNAVEAVIRDGLWDRFRVAPVYRDWIRNSWEMDRHTIVGRFDFAYDGESSPKMLEYNADTPTGLLEASAIQWYWLQDCCPDMDQFNSIHDRLVEAWQRFLTESSSVLYFLSTAGHVEDYMNVNYLRDTAMQAGARTEYLSIEELGFDQRSEQFVDAQDRAIQSAFKLYPWEWMLDEAFGKHLVYAKMKWLEPPWKILLSNKMIMTVLWDMYPGNPYLLETSSAKVSGDFVRKPCQSREGQGVEICVGGNVVAGIHQSDSGTIYQRYHPTGKFDGQTPVIGSWMINGHAAGIGIREDSGLVTGNDSRFVPHFFC
jgi:glutathionylspermidine synthase